jgi:hypothetical protein
MNIRCTILSSLFLLALAPACQVSTNGLLGKGASEPSSSPASSSKSEGAVAAKDSGKGGASAPAAATRGEKWRALSVVTKLPQFKAEDSYDLEKVTAAFAALDKKAVVVTKAKELVQYRPAPSDKSVDSRTRGGKCGTKGLEAFGASYLRESSGFGKIALEYDLCELDYDHVPVGTPGVVWSSEWAAASGQKVGTTKIVFVTLDGGRYTLEDHDWLESPIANEATPAASWPAFPLHSFLGEREVSALSDEKSKTTAKNLEAAKTAWDNCMSPVLDREEAEYKANNASSVTSDQRSAKNRQTAAKFEALRDKTCGGQKTKISNVLLGYLTDRAAKRSSLLDANKGRFGN